MSDLMTFTGSKISGSIILGFTKLIYVINYGLKKYFPKRCLGLVKNENCLQFVLASCVMTFLRTHMLDYDEIDSCMERAYIGSLFIKHGDAETSMEKLKIFYALIN